MKIVYALFAAFFLYWLVIAAINYQVSASPTLDNRWIRYTFNLFMFSLAFTAVVFIHAI